MAPKKVNITLDVPEETDLILSGEDQQGTLRVLAAYFLKMSGRQYSGIHIITIDDFVETAEDDIVLNGATGAITVTIEDIEVTVIATPGQDVANAALLAEAINDKPQLKTVVRATASGNIVTVEARHPGVCGNAIGYFTTGTGISGGTILDGGRIGTDIGFEFK